MRAPKSAVVITNVAGPWPARPLHALPAGPRPVGSVLEETGDPFGTDEPCNQTRLDTHAGLVGDRGRRLTPSARRTSQRARAAGGLALSLISVWEVAKKVEKGRSCWIGPSTIGSIGGVAPRPATG